jgi:Na+-transporting NADH:ubiquinone oxidoreductase subunit NqrD
MKKLENAVTLAIVVAGVGECEAAAVTAAAVTTAAVTAAAVTVVVKGVAAVETEKQMPKSLEIL